VVLIGKAIYNNIGVIAIMMAREQIKAAIDQLSEEQVQALEILVNTTLCPSEEKEDKLTHYEASIWDDWDNQEVDAVYGKLYHQLQRKGGPKVRAYRVVTPYMGV
jgi:hypothetical protein